MAEQKEARVPVALCMAPVSIPIRDGICQMEMRPFQKTAVLHVTSSGPVYFNVSDWEPVPLMEDLTDDQAEYRALVMDRLRAKASEEEKK